MSTHIGKIGRLSKGRREELGERMEDGQTGKELAEWLNGLPDVQALLKEKFGGLPVNEQNVTNWRQSGHVNWLRLREGRARVMRLVSDAGELSAVAGGHRPGDCLATILAVELDGLGRALLGDEEADLEKRWERFCEVHRQVSRLRRDDDRVKRTSLREKALGEKARGGRLRARGGDEEEVQRPEAEGGTGMKKEELRMKNGAQQDAQDLKDAGNTGLESPVNSQAGKPALHKKEQPEPADEDVCVMEEEAPPTPGFGATSGGEGAERPANQDKSRQIKVENEAQNSTSKLQGLKAEMAGLKRDGNEDGQRNGSQGNNGQGDGDGDATEPADWENDERILNAVVTPLTPEGEKRLAEENRLWRIKAGFEELTEKV